MLDCCEPLEKVKAEGITFGKVACLANCAGAKVNAFRANQTSIDEFRAFIKKCATSEDSHVIASYHRAPFKQTGSGHFSPIGGYHARRDMALILDVARFKYPPHWVPLSLLWEAMNTMDESTQHYRGFMIISKRQQAPSLLYTLSCRHESWKSISNYLMEEVPRLLKAEGIDSIQKVFSVIFASLPANVTDFVKWIAEVRRLESSEKTVDNEEADRLAVKAEILQQIRATELYKTVNEWMSSATRCCNLSWSTEDNLSEIASHVCCQAAATLCGMLGTTEGSCCRKYCIKVIETNDNMPLTVVSGTVITNGAEQGVDMLIPNAGQVKHPVCHMHKVEGSSANWLHMYPASGDVLTILLLALPPQTWHELQEKGLQEKIYHIVSIADLSAGLQEEVLHLRRQLYLVHSLQNGKIEEDVRDALVFMQCA